MRQSVTNGGVELRTNSVHVGEVEEPKLSADSHSSKMPPKDSLISLKVAMTKTMD